MKKCWLGNASNNKSCFLHDDDVYEEMYLSDEMLKAIKIIVHGDVYGDDDMTPVGVKTMKTLYDETLDELIEQHVRSWINAGKICYRDRHTND